MGSTTSILDMAFGTAIRLRYHLVALTDATGALSQAFKAPGWSRKARR